jgi:hypothetical protein
MQTSGTCAPLSDGVKKTIVGATAPKASGTVRPDPPKPKAANHRGGGHAKHARRGK